MRKAILVLYNLIFILIPLVFYAKTSEVFEFNKMVLVYAFTILIVCLWVIRMVSEKKFIFRRTILDIPLIVFFFSQFVSTLISIDTRSSIFGYYSRFNGGILSTISYALLYWAYVANADRQDSEKLIRTSLVVALLVAIYGIFEHFGGSVSCLIFTGKFDDNCWVQDVRTRVFATLGQPNWLAAYLVALLPSAWSKFFENFSAKSKFPKFLWLGISAVLFWAIIYTKSRSGLLGLGVAGLVFGGWTVFQNKKNFQKIIFPASILGLLIIAGVGLSGTPWTPSIKDLIEKKSINQLTNQLNATSEGGTESGDIRKIVWKGAINVWKAYPIFGTGPETFAFAYYMYRPVEHNLVSEWDFLYNKAHNEYLNYLANTGSVGLLAYLALIIFSLYLLRKNPALLAGYASILVTNFFGFSVVVIQVLFFLLPVLAVSLGRQPATTTQPRQLSGYQKLTTIAILISGAYCLLTVYRYWSADVAYARAKAEIEVGKISASVRDLDSAIKKVPHEPLYHDKLAQVYAAVAAASAQEKDASGAAQLTQLAIAEADTAMNTAPKNFIVLQDRANIYSDLTAVDSSYLLESIKTLEYLATYAPTYAKIYYRLGLAYLRIGQTDKAMQNFKKAIELKSDYLDAKRALNSISPQKTQ